MFFTATNRMCSQGKQSSVKKGLMGLAWMFMLSLMIGCFSVALAQESTTLTLKLKGVTPSDSVTWRSIALSAHFNVEINGVVVGQVTANPSPEQLTAGETDTIALPTDATSVVTLVPVAEDIPAGFVCNGPIPITVTWGQDNRKTVFAYATRGLFNVQDVTADGVALGSAEFVVLNSLGEMQWSFTTGDTGEYTAEQALPNGDYQLVQMRAPEGMALADQPILFTVDTYFGTAQSIISVPVVNQPASTQSSLQDEHDSATDVAALPTGNSQSTVEPLAQEQLATIVGKVDAISVGASITAVSLTAQYSAITEADGSFTFVDLTAGDYTVYAPLADGKTLLPGNAWQVSQQGDMVWLAVSVNAGETQTLPEVAYIAKTGIQGVAYMDTDGDLQYTQGEQLMSGVTVALQRKEGDSWSDVANQMTDAYGSYAFDNLTAGVYRVAAQAGAGVAVAAVGASAQTLGDADLGIKTSTEINLQNGDVVSAGGDVALVQPATLMVAAFFDSNENGLRGPYERPLTGITVEAVPGEDAQGTAAASAVTDAQGEATLDNLTPGTYLIRFTLPDGYLYTVDSGKWALDSSCVGNVENLTAVSHAITLVGGETVQAGVGAIPVGAFSGRVWNDINNNGVMDADEPGVADVHLTLTGVKNGSSYELTTDDTGSYRFALLRNDTYNFTADIPDGMLFARYTQTGGDNRSVFTTEGTTSTRQFVITDAQDVSNKNVGVIQKAILSGVAFLDANYNGIYDEGEPTYAGVTLELIKNSNSKSIGKVVTGEDGSYVFDALRGGDYSLRAILPEDGSIFTIVPAGAQGLYNQFVAREGRRENTLTPITVENGHTAETCVGVAMGGTIKGTVFLDAKYDGIRQDSDKSASGVKVQLVDATGALVATDTTNANGNYTLDGIMPGEYTVRFQRRDGYAFTRYRPQEENGNCVQTLAKDGYGETEPIAVAMGQMIERINAGMLPSSTVTGIFFDDTNDNGLMEDDETGYTDGKVRLLSEDGEIDLTESVAENGAYFFDGVMPGEYSVTYLLPENATIATIAEGGNTLSAQGQQNVLEGLTVESGKAYTAPLVGAVTLGTLQGYAYHDTNGNGIQDEGEALLPGATVTLQPDQAGMDTATVMTDRDGRFAIADLHPAVYTMTLALPEGYIFSGDMAGSGISLDTAQTDTLACTWATLTNRVENTIGAVEPATIQASVWLDENRDGRHEDEERLFSGLAYELYDEAKGKVVKTAQAADDGYVTFENVRPATYTVRFTIPDQAQAAENGEGTLTLQGGRMSQSGIVVAEGESVDGINGGLVSYTSIGGSVALEENGARTPQAGISILLYTEQSDAVLQTATTDENGIYRFDGLWPDTYRLEAQLPNGTIFVQPDDPNYPQGESVIVRNENGMGESDPFALQMARHMLSQNILLIKPARVGDQVWLDSNANGLIDTDEPCINGVTIQLQQNGEVKYTTQTNEWGYYELSDVYPGTYTLVAQTYTELDITQSVPSLLVISSCLTSGDGSNASSDEFSVESGTRNFDFNLGYVLRSGETLPTAIKPGAVQNWAK